MLTLVVLFTNAHVFPVASSYSGFTIFFMICSSLPLVVFFIFILFECCEDATTYIILLVTFSLLAFPLLFVIFFGPPDVFEEYQFFSYNATTGVFATLIGLWMGQSIVRY